MENKSEYRKLCLCVCGLNFGILLTWLHDCHNSLVTSPKDALQDQALANLKLIFQIISEFENESSKDRKLIFEYALRFSFAELERIINQLNEYMPDAALREKSAFLTPLPTSINPLKLQPNLLVLQKYLLAALL